ncbi:MAG: aldehyde dehydrogenase family protein [Anaerolineales bacterium]
MDREKLAFINPANGTQFGEVTMSTPEEVKQAVDDMRASFSVWSAKSVKERARILKKFQQLLIDQRDEISSVVSQSTGKNRQDSLIELFVSVDMLAQNRAKAATWLKRRRVSSGLYFTKRSYVEHRPYGVAAIISPWNYPLLISITPMFAALLAGNTVVLKVSEVTPAVGALIEKLFNSVPELAPFVRVVHGDGRVGAALTKSKPDYIFVTGSTVTGKKIMQSVAEDLIPVTLELGSKDAAIILEDADIDSAARWITWGAYFNSGQSCVAVERAYVVESKYDEFVQAAVKYTEKIASGFTLEKDSPYFMGPITDPRQIQIIENHVKEAVEKGARIVCGGKEQGAFYKPMVMVDVNHSMKLMREETFGPILPIMKVRDEEEAIRLANDSAFGLFASVYTKDQARAKRIADRINASSIITNDSLAQFGIPLLPFGGVKDSGIGTSHGREGLLAFTRPHSYAMGGTPPAWDVATIMRELGNYDLGVAIMGVVYGTTLKQKWETFSQFLRRGKKEKVSSGVKPEPVTTK